MGMLLVDVGLLPSATVTPFGSPVTAKVTAPVKLLRTMVAVVEPVPPWATETVVRLSEIEAIEAKGLTTSVSCTDAAGIPGPVPLSVMGYVPGVACAVAESETTIELPVVGDGEMFALTPVGSVPSTANVTSPRNSVRRTMMVVETASPPRSQCASPSR